MNKIQKTDHFYLIDGSGYIFRAYYALPPLSRKSDGLPTGCLLYTSPSPRDLSTSRMPSSA